MRPILRLLKSVITAFLILTIFIILVGGAMFLLRDRLGLPSMINKPAPPSETNTQVQVVDAVCDEKTTLKDAKTCSLLIGDVENHGTGFVHPSGDYLITNYHVIESYETGYANVFYEGRFHSSRIAGLSLEDDIAVIRLDDKLPGCGWSDSSSLELAENVYAIGWPNSPYGESTITKGIFSRYAYLDDESMPMIQTDTPINPGNSGGPLINRCGVIGINTSKINWIDESAPSEGIGYAIASNYASEIVEQLIQNDDGQPKIPTEKIASSTPVPESSNNDEIQTNYLSPNSLVAYDYEQVLFWENRMLNDEAVLKSWEKAKGSDFVDQDRLDDLIEKVERSLEIAEILWDGYTNSKITYAQVLQLKQEYLFLSKESTFLTNELNLEGSINAYKNCVEAWEKLEEEYEDDFSEQKEGCEEIIEFED